MTARLCSSSIEVGWHRYMYQAAEAGWQPMTPRRVSSDAGMSCAWAPWGNALAAAYQDGLVCLWDARCMEVRPFALFLSGISRLNIDGHEVVAEHRPVSRQLDGLAGSSHVFRFQSTFRREICCLHACFAKESHLLLKVYEAFSRL